MGINGILSNYPGRYWAGKTEKNTSERCLISQKNYEQKHFVNKSAVSVEISEEGKHILRETVRKFEPESDYTNVKELTIQNTNEVAWEHYTAMRGLSSKSLKDGNYNAEDIMQSIMEAYEARYNEIVKEHENGDREVAYELTGKRSLTLDEDLAGLDEAFKMRLANLEGYITCQQTNKAFENPDSSWYFHRNSPHNEEKRQDKSQFSDKQYRDFLLSVMEKAKEEFLTAFKIKYKESSSHK